MSSASPKPPSAWPKLSETLPFRQIGCCQQCQSLPMGSTASALTYWQECDQADTETPVFVVLYKQKISNTVLPGVMPICDDCPARERLRCASPAAMFNGGPAPGLRFEPEGSMVHLCRSPRSLSGWQYILPGPITRCSGKDAALARLESERREQRRGTCT